MDIGDEQVYKSPFQSNLSHLLNYCVYLQRMLFNRLRFLIDYHQITKNAKFGEREKITNLVRDELQHFSRSTGDVRPKNVQRRLDDHDLYVKYFTSDALMDDEAFKDNSSGNSISDDLRMESNSDDDMKMRMAKQIEQKVYSGPRQPVHKQPAKMVPSLPVNGPSLLKPLHQRKIEANETARIRVVRPETGLQVEKPNITKDQPTQQISMSRLRLAAALCKAKTAQNAQTRVGVDSPEPERMIAALSVKCATPLSSSQSSNDSSGETELIRDELTPDQCSQETFLRIFGLHTPAYTQYLMNRRPQRKKRTCTSTARGDFHYGKFELFEKQFANKRNKKQFLYSPPATRAKRRVGSNGTNASAKDLPKRGRTIKSTASSSSSLSSNGSNNVSEKVCLTCYKRSK